MYDAVELLCIKKWVMPSNSRLLFSLICVLALIKMGEFCAYFYPFSLQCVSEVEAIALVVSAQG
jgi:hypothetical protein